MDTCEGGEEDRLTARGSQAFARDAAILLRSMFNRRGYRTARPMPLDSDD
jgi:hypothetical protein